MKASERTRWREAAVQTVALWLFVFVIFLPVLIDRHKSDGLAGFLLDISTFSVSILFGLLLFALFLATENRRTVTRILAMTVGVVVVSLIQMMFDVFYLGWVGSNFPQHWEALPRSLVRSYGAAFNYICAFGVNVALFHLAAERRRIRMHERSLAVANAAAQAAQLAALRFQLNPHFLFNTLNAISAMIVTGRNADAEAMTDKLSSFLRASLASAPDAMVPVHEELAMIGDYLEIETVRFGARLRVEYRCAPEAADALVPSFLLQPVAENAVKYGVAPSRDPVTIRIGAAIDGDDLLLTVEDDGMGDGSRGEVTRSTGVGLANIRRRLNALYGEAGRLTAMARASGFVAEIRLPARFAARGARG